MKLYMHPASPNSRKVAMTAAILGVPLDAQVVNLMAGEQRKPEFLKINPNGLVPVLQDGDFVLIESNAIMQYLAATQPGNTLWPNDERARADINHWQCWELAHWSPALAVFIFENMFKAMFGQGGPDPAALKQGGEKLQRFGGVLDAHLAQRDFIVGRGLTLADLSVAALLMYTKPGRVPLDKFPNVMRWFARIEQLPAWQATQPAMN